MSLLLQRTQYYLHTGTPVPVSPKYPYFKDRCEELAKPVPQAFRHIHDGAEFKAESVQPVNDALAESLDLADDPIPYGSDGVAELLVLIILIR